MAQIYLMVKDEKGQLRPMAGCWNDDRRGKEMGEMFLSKKGNENCEVVRVELTEIEQYE